MYTKPSMTKLGTLRELTQSGCAPGQDLAGFLIGDSTSAGFLGNNCPRGS